MGSHMEQEKEGNRAEQILNSLSLAGLINGFRHYVSTFRDVFRYRGQYAAICLGSDAPRNFNLAISVYLYGTILCFILIFAFGQLHGISLSKVYFVLWYVHWQALVVLISHLAAKIARGKAGILDTAAVCCTFYGILYPLGLFLIAPLFIYIPIDTLNPNENTTDLNLTKNQIWFLGIWFLSAATISIVVSVMIGLRWIAIVHKIKLRWLFAVYFLIYIPFIVFHAQILAPIIDPALHFVSDLITNLL